MALVPDRYLTGSNVPGMADFMTDIGLGDFPTTVPISSGGYTYSSGVDLANYDNMVFMARLIPGSGSTLNTVVEWSHDDAAWAKQIVVDFTLQGDQGIAQTRPSVFSKADIYVMPVARLERYVRFGVQASGIEDGDAAVGARPVHMQF